MVPKHLPTLLLSQNFILAIHVAALLLSPLIQFGDDFANHSRSQIVCNGPALNLLDDLSVAVEGTVNTILRVVSLSSCSIERILTSPVVSNTAVRVVFPRLTAASRIAVVYVVVVIIGGAGITHIAVNAH